MAVHAIVDGRLSVIAVVGVVRRQERCALGASDDQQDREEKQTHFAHLRILSRGISKKCFTEDFPVSYKYYKTSFE